jgi:hypothetical protein
VSDLHDGWQEQTRTLSYEPGGFTPAAVDLQGRLARPSPSELMGGLTVHHRIFMCTPSEYERALPGHTPSSDDVVTAGARRYSLENWDWVYAGAERVWLRAEVVG